MRKLGSRKR